MMTGVIAANGIASARTMSGSPSRVRMSPSPARGGHAVEAGLAVALVIHAHVVLGDPDQAIGLVRPFVALAAAALLDRIAGLRLDIGERAPARQRLDLPGVVALRDQLPLALEHVVEDIAGIADRARVAGDAEFLRRHCLDAGGCVGAFGFDGDIVKERIARCE
jgi:hypothetical protein